MIYDVRRADLIADIAHTACGQTRADGVTPYIVHPRRVRALVEEWAAAGKTELSQIQVEIAVCAALLHDVLEDTRLTREDLIRYGVQHDVLEVVELLTKPDDGPAPAAYYQGIAGDDVACVVKCADRCANLEDALAEIHATRGLKRWRRYVEKTRTDVLPIYASLPALRAELEARLAAIDAALPPDAERVQDPPPHGPPDDCEPCTQWRARHPRRVA
jgi:(p)ppGpp synthase/HD superfamily hydrolase